MSVIQRFSKRWRTQEFSTLVKLTDSPFHEIFAFLPLLTPTPLFFPATSSTMTMRQTLALLSRKLITIPSLSPTHTSSRIITRLVPTNTHVIEYQPIVTLQCSPDLIADPADRKSACHEPRMLLESLEEGTVRWKKMSEEDDEESQWYPVGTVIGEIIEDENDDGDGEVEEWTWQAYLDEDD